jgi:putative DNA primase/helicase
MTPADVIAAERKRIHEAAEDAPASTPRPVRNDDYAHAGEHLDGDSVASASGRVRVAPPALTRARATDAGNATRLAALHGEDFRYVATWNRWLAWDGTRWVADDSAVRMQALAKNTARELYLAAAGDPKLGKWAIETEKRARLEAMIHLAKSESHIAIRHNELDADPWLMTVANGTINLRTGELRPHDRKDLGTKVTNVLYDPARAACPTWEAFLLRCMGGDADLVRYLQRIVGYALTGATTEHALFFLFGAGANGKSTFLGALHDIFGDYGAHAPRTLLWEAKSERHETELTVLHGARFVSCAEIPEDAKLDEARAKDLTGGDPITARRMREDHWTFAPTHKLFVAGNHKPRIDGRDEGIWRRVRLVPWTVTIPIEERDRELATKLRAERDSIFAWAVRGCLEWQAHGLGDPPAVVEATSAFRDESDPFAEFFLSRCTFDPHAKCARMHLRHAYEEWCKETGARPFGTRRWAAMLRARGVTDGGSIRTHVGVRDAWQGIDLRSAETAD